MNIWRVTGIVLTAGLALFLVSILLKLLVVALAAFLVVRVAAGRLMGRGYGPLGRGNWSANNIISIDNPAYRSPMNRAGYDRRSDVSVISIN